MTSYASVDRIEDDIAVCEVELIHIDDSHPGDFLTKPTQMMEIYLEKLPHVIQTIEEGDILVVEHNGQEIIKIWLKDRQEKQRRIEILRKMRG